MKNILTEYDHIKSLPEFDKHSLVTFLYDDKTGLEGFIVIHRKNKDRPSFGATRMWHYVSDAEALNDTLRLSKMMSYKAALAGLKCGGAKGVIMRPLDSEYDRKNILRAYAEKVKFFKDHFVTGTDVGVEQEDLKIMRSITPNVVGFNNNSTEFTVHGIYESVKCCFDEIFGDDSIQGRTFSIQGLGKVGAELLKLLYKDAEKIYASEIDSEKVANIKKLYPKVIIVKPEDIHKQKADVFSPCALGHSLNSQSITELGCKIVIGGANNQLENESIGDLLYKLGILYAPDYVVNAGGLIAVVDEYENGRYSKRKVSSKVMSIKKTLTEILTKSRKQRKATNIVANEMAEVVLRNYN